MLMDGHTWALGEEGAGSIGGPAVGLVGDHAGHRGALRGPHGVSAAGPLRSLPNQESTVIARRSNSNHKPHRQCASPGRREPPSYIPSPSISHPPQTTSRLDIVPHPLIILSHPSITEQTQRAQTFLFPAQHDKEGGYCQHTSNTPSPLFNLANARKCLPGRRKRWREACGRAPRIPGAAELPRCACRGWAEIFRRGALGDRWQGPGAGLATAL